MFNYSNNKKSINFRHGNAGLIVINYEYKRLFKKDLLDVSKFIPILKYNYSNKISFDYGILGIIYAFKCLYKENKSKEIKDFIDKKEEVLSIMIKDEYYKSNFND